MLGNGYFSDLFLILSCYHVWLALFPVLEMDPEEKEKLMKEIETLKEEIASMKKSSVLGDQQPRDIVRECIASLFLLIPSLSLSFSISFPSQ